MIKGLMVALLTTFPVFAQTSPPPNTPLTDREQVQADRAKAAAEEKGATTVRPWDRDADGKRPWERKSISK